MAETTGISWTHHTWNPWVGCHKVSPGCAHCYMFRGAKQYGIDPLRVRRTTTVWDAPARWQRKAAKLGINRCVFVCSQSDFFLSLVDPWRPDAWAVMRSCPNLYFQILTKRPERIAGHLPPDWGVGYPNVWLGVSVENARFKWRMDVLREISARLRFISAEPLLADLGEVDLTCFGWVIAGGESGPIRRPIPPAAPRHLRDQCVRAGVPFFFKQESALQPGTNPALDGVVWHQFPPPFEAQSLRPTMPPF